MLRRRDSHPREPSSGWKRARSSVAKHAEKPGEIEQLRGKAPPMGWKNTEGGNLGGNPVLVQAAQRGGAISILGGVQDQAGESPEKPCPTPGLPWAASWAGGSQGPPCPSSPVEINNNKVTAKSGQCSQPFNPSKAGSCPLASAQCKMLC